MVFDYVGIRFTNRLSLFKIAERMAVKGKKVISYVLNSLTNYKCLPYNVFFKIFDSKVAPILSYSSEIWGINSHHCIESVQNIAC